MRANKTSTTQGKQQGAALIAVLVILVVITLLGVTAMRMGLTGLTLATNSQVSALLFQAADKGMADMNLAIAKDVTAAMQPTGIVGPRGTDNAHCVMTTPGNVDGFIPPPAAPALPSRPCNVNTDFLSGRSIDVVQVNTNLRSLTDIESNSGVSILLNKGTGGGKVTLPDKLVISSTSVMVGLGSADPPTINNCLLQKSDDALDVSVVTITDCLTDAGAIFTTHQDESLSGFNF